MAKYESNFHKLSKVLERLRKETKAIVKVQLLNFTNFNDQNYILWD